MHIRISLALPIAAAVLGVSALFASVKDKPSPPIPVRLPSNGPVRLTGRGLMTDFDGDGVYTAFFIQGVGYSPTAVGYNPQWGYENPDPRIDNLYNDPQILERDLPLIRAIDANVIRIWGGDDVKTAMNEWPIRLTTATFDKALKYKIRIIAGFRMPWRGYFNEHGQYVVLEDFTDPILRADLLTRFAAFVQSWKNHKALLFWAIGNENDLRFSVSHDPDYWNQIRAYFSLVNEMAREAHRIEGAFYHPVAAVNGTLESIGDPAKATADADLPALDIWGLNHYPGASFGSGPSLFELFNAKTSKPLWLSETSRGDNWHVQDPLGDPEIGHEDQTTIATGNAALWDEIEANRSITLGATYMEWSDEWWKPDQWADCGGGPGSCNYVHNHDGFGPAGGWIPPAPDQYFNEEWWGFVSIAANPVLYDPDIVTPRETYYTMQQKWQ